MQLTGGQSMQCVTFVFPHAVDDNKSSDISRVNSSISFTDLVTWNITTLSTNHANPSSDVEGLLFVPSVNPNGTCSQAADTYQVPENVTRIDNLPLVPTAYVAMAPWLNYNCSREYLESAAETPNIEAFLFFIPGNTTDTPPSGDDHMWDLHNSQQYKNYPYPVYVVPGRTGERLMNASAWYSVNMTDVPNGNVLAETYDSRDYVRLWVEVDTAPAGAIASLPTLWAFLLIVVGILLGVIAITSLSMHLIQRRRRQRLRRRVANGEVDLEALGIKRLAVPQEILDRMPLYVYGSTPTKAREYSGAAHDAGPPLQQPTCAICLDDFVPASGDDQGTIVRELPCRHIFHPECVDTFLRDSSSLCPMCKKSALPKGYCPKVITNAMVRRERIVYRMRARLSAEEHNNAGETPDFSTPPAPARQSTRLSFLPAWRPHRRVTSAPVAAAPAMTEMTSTHTPSVGRSNTVSQASDGQGRIYHIQPPSTPGRREWARQRAIAMLGRRAPDDPDLEDAQNTPRWKKAMRAVFPSAGRSSSTP